MENIPEAAYPLARHWILTDFSLDSQGPQEPSMLMYQVEGRLRDGTVSQSLYHCHVIALNPGPGDLCTAPFSLRWAEGGHVVLLACSGIPETAGFRPYVATSWVFQKLIQLVCLPTPRISRWMP